LIAFVILNKKSEESSWESLWCEEEFSFFGNKTWLYKCEDLFYLVTATIVLHNMMVEVRIKIYKMESVDLYNHVNMQCELNSDDEVDSSEDGDSNVAEVTVGNFDMSCARGNILKYRILQERWKSYTPLRIHCNHQGESSSLGHFPCSSWPFTHSCCTKYCPEHRSLLICTCCWVFGDANVAPYKEQEFFLSVATSPL
jgi:hypothetical protein